MKDDGIFIEIRKCFKALSDHAGSLILDVDSNLFEQFHFFVAKHIGGKRIKFCLGMSYTMRCMHGSCGAIQHKKFSVLHV
jgi:hypothetical protein